jgi:uncharacterized protein (DUF2249 family)
MIVIDARGWEPPKPFESVLDALASLPPGEKLRLVVEREPRPLYRVLDREGYAWFATVRSDGVYEVDICRRTPA